MAKKIIGDLSEKGEFPLATVTFVFHPHNQLQSLTKTDKLIAKLDLKRKDHGFKSQHLTSPSKIRNSLWPTRTAAPPTSSGTGLTGPCWLIPERRDSYALRHGRVWEKHPLAVSTNQLFLRMPSLKRGSAFSSNEGPLCLRRVRKVRKEKSHDGSVTMIIITECPFVSGQTLRTASEIIFECIRRRSCGNM